MSALPPKADIYRTSLHVRFVPIEICGSYMRERSDNPILRAFRHVALSVRFRFLAILPAGVFFRASDFKVRTSAVVQVRLFTTISESENIRLIAQMGAERERASHRSKNLPLMSALCQKRKSRPLLEEQKFG